MKKNFLILYLLLNTITFSNINKLTLKQKQQLEKSLKRKPFSYQEKYLDSTFYINLISDIYTTIALEKILTNGVEIVRYTFSKKEIENNPSLNYKINELLKSELVGVEYLENDIILMYAKSFEKDTYKFKGGNIDYLANYLDIPGFKNHVIIEPLNNFDSGSNKKKLLGALIYELNNMIKKSGGKNLDFKTIPPIKDAYSKITKPNEIDFGIITFGEVSLFSKIDFGFEKNNDLTIYSFDNSFYNTMIYKQKFYNYSNMKDNLYNFMSQRVCYGYSLSITDSYVIDNFLKISDINIFIDLIENKLK